jgi:hypothetical protein
MTEYLLDHQWMFIRQLPVSSPNLTDTIRCANRLPCRFVDARYNLKCTTALRTGSDVDVKNPFKSLHSGHRLVFLCSADNACLALFRFTGVIVMRSRLFWCKHTMTNLLGMNLFITSM